MFIEKHPADTPEQCFALARHTVENMRGAVSYAFCYDGYIDTDAGMADALIAEGGLPGEPQGCALGLIYHIDDEGKYHFESEVVYIGPAPNFMAGTQGPAPVEQEPDVVVQETDEIRVQTEEEDGELREGTEQVIEGTSESPYDLTDASAQDFPTLAESEADQKTV